MSQNSYTISLVDVASAIYYNDLNESKETSVTKILTWLIAHIGELNTRLAARICIVGNDCQPQLRPAQAAIFGMLFLYNYYLRLVRENLGAAAFSVLEVQEGDSSVRLVNRNEIAKTYRGLAQDTLANLNKLCLEYKQNVTLPASINNPYLQSWGWLGSFLYQKQIDGGGFPEFCPPGSGCP